MAEAVANTFRVLLYLVTALLHVVATAQDSLVSPPKTVKVLPVFLVPRGQKTPSEEEQSRLMAHLRWSQSFYRSQLGQGVTFQLAQDQPLIVTGSEDLESYKSQPEGGAPKFVAELLDRQGFTRMNCPYVYVVLLANPSSDFPTGGGRPLNGGYNTGGGVVIMSLWALNNAPNFQSTIRHELGHAFGLPHVDVYGYEMGSNASVMSYNPAHHTHGFKEASVLPSLIPEDRRGLALNQRVFRGLRFRPESEVPSGYRITSRPTPLGPMVIPGHPYKVEASTSSGEKLGSSAANITQDLILPSIKTGEVSFNSGHMWHPDVPQNKWVTVDLRLPYESSLDQLEVYTQHSGLYHKSEEVRVSYRNAEGKWVQIARHPTPANSFSFRFRSTKAREWRLSFRAKDEPGATVVVRGVRFYREGVELFPTLVPISSLTMASMNPMQGGHQRSFSGNLHLGAQPRHRA